jgi:hypothetical protein
LIAIPNGLSESVERAMTFLYELLVHRFATVPKPLFGFLMTNLGLIALENSRFSDRKSANFGRMRKGQALGIQLHI